MAVELEKENPSVLVVDDQASVRLTLKGILARKGYGVAVASSGEEALDLARQTRFQVVFMDIKMPGLNGVETFIQMKAINPDSTVIMITGYAVEDDVKRALQEGAHAIVYKPFDIDKILSMVARCLKR